MGKPNHTAVLAKAVAKSFATAGFAASDLLQGYPAFTDLTWQNPPLQFDDPLQGFPFHDYVSYPNKVDFKALYSFWRTNLPLLYSSPAHIITAAGWKQSSLVLPTSSAGERALRFCVPENFPYHHDYNGHVFSMEVANLFYTSGMCWKFVSDADNYWVQTKIGDDFVDVGVRDGVVIDSAEWTVPMHGMVDTLLSNGRGVVDATCRYDLIAKVRSTLYEHDDKFPEFGALDWALQALAKLTQNRVCDDLLLAIQNMMPDTVETKRKIRLIDEALEQLDAWTVNDQIKVAAMFEILTPTVFSIGAFYAQVCNLSKKVPSVLAPETLKRMEKNLLKRREILVNDLTINERPAFARPTQDQDEENLSSGSDR